MSLISKSYGYVKAMGVLTCHFDLSLTCLWVS